LFDGLVTVADAEISKRWVVEDKRISLVIIYCKYTHELYAFYRPTGKGGFLRTKNSELARGPALPLFESATA